MEQVVGHSNPWSAKERKSSWDISGSRVSRFMALRSMMSLKGCTEWAMDSRSILPPLRLSASWLIIEMQPVDREVALALLPTTATE